MNIAVKGSEARILELNDILSSANLSFTKLESTKNIHSSKFDVIFDLNFDDDHSSLEDYLLLESNTLLAISSVKIQIEALLPKSLWNQTVGINALQTFLKRTSIEYCYSGGDSFDETIFMKLGWQKANRTLSRVGFVSPRVVFTIINEAYFTLQEGTANKVDIDLGMKLGTAYPLGPFEWSEKIGVKDVYETLLALYHDTSDERYKICSLLKTEYLLGMAK
ncbi:MAG: 3-hydroxyacyl-CoA dehydrogenase family protein [Bacteroidia bacterium]